MKNLVTVFWTVLLKNLVGKITKTTVQKMFNLANALNKTYIISG